MVSAINDIQDARLEYHKSWSDLKLTEEHMYGTEYEASIKTTIGKKIEKCTGASNLYGGTGVTISENGIENVERAFNNFDNFQIKQMTHDEKSMKIFRFEVVKDMTVRSGNSIKIENVKIGVN